MWNKKWFGFWKEDGDHYSKCPSVNEWVDCVKTDTRVIDYLDGGSFVSASPVVVQCHISNEIIDSSKVILTDGYWMWPKDLSHYVSKHRVQVPHEFYLLMKLKGFTCPKVDDDFDIMNLEYPE